MKKLLFIVTLIATLSISACGPKESSQKDQSEPTQAVKKNANETPIHEKYAKQIAQELKATNWSYTWEYLLPKNEDILIDFYVWEPLVDHTVWLCNEKECKLLRTEHY